MILSSSVNNGVNCWQLNHFDFDRFIEDWITDKRHRIAAKYTKHIRKDCKKITNKRLTQVLVDFRQYLLARHFNVTTSQLLAQTQSFTEGLTQLLLWSQHGMHWRRTLGLNPAHDLKSKPFV